VAVVSVALALLAHRVAAPWLVDRASFLPLYGAVAVTAVLGGWRPGAAATALGVVLALALLVPPEGALVGKSAADVARVALFGALAGGLCWLGGSAHDARRRLGAERRRREREQDGRHEAQERVDLAVQATGLGVWRADHRAGLVEWCGRCREIFGLPGAGRITPEMILERIHPDDRDLVVRATELSLDPERGGPFSVEHRVVRPDGEVRWVSAFGRELPGGQAAGGGPRIHTGVLVDVTDRKRTEDRLRAGDERFRLAADAVDGIVYEYDFATGRVERSRGLFEVAGYRPEEAPPTADWWVGLIHPDDVDRTLQTFAAARGHDRTLVEYRVRHRDGRWLHVEDRAVVLRDAAGRPERIVGCTINVTERKGAEERLRYSEELHRIGFDQSPTGMVHVGPDGRFLRVNPAYCDITGYAADELLRMRVTDLTHPDDRAGDAALIDPYLAGASPTYANEKRYVRKDGGVRRVAVTARMVTDAEGRPLHSLAVIRDVTDQRRTEDRLRLAVEVAGLGVLAIDYDADTATPDATAAALFGLEPGVAVSRSQVHARFHPDDRDEVERRMRGCLDPGGDGGFAMEHRVVLPDGTTRWLRVRKQVVFAGEAGGARRPASGVLAAVDVTALKEAEEALRASERRLAAVLDRLPIGVGLMGPDGRMALLNPAMGRFVPGRVPSLDPERRERWRTWAPDGTPVEPRDWPAQRAMRGEAVFPGVEFRFTGDDGRDVWASVAATPLPDAEGAVAGAVVVVQDIDQRKQAERLLAGQRHVLEMVAAGRPLAEVLAATCRVIEEQEPGLLCSVLLPDEGRRQIGMAVAPGLPDDHVRGLVGLPIGPPFSGSCAEALSGGGVVVVPDVAADRRYAPEWRALLDARGLRACQSVPVAGSDGTVLASFAMYRREPVDPAPSSAGLTATATHLVGIAVEREQAERRLRASEEEFRTLADHMSQFAWMADGTGSVYWYNRRWYEYTGTTPDQMQGWGWKSVHHPDHVERVARRLQHSWDTGEPWEDTFPLRGADGSYRWFLSRAVPVRDEAGRIVRWLGTNTDVTEQRDLERALQEADRRKDEFLATLAHELRNPLAPIRNALQLMKLAGGDAAALETSRSMMERQVGQMRRLVDDLMDVSRIGQGKIVLQRTRLRLADAVQDAVEIARPLIAERGHDLVLDLPAEPVHVDGDRTRLAQVFGNLLNNAAKYTEEGGRIRVAAARRGADLVVHVEDNGVGIPAPMLPRVFDIFTQVDRSLERSQGGLGIGLSLVKRLVEMHGGSIEAHSDGPGRGSRFVVHLPAAEAPAAAESPNGTGGAADAAPARRRILVADDNRDGANSLARVLRLMGNDTRTAFDGQEAVEVGAAFRPDVILMDIGMPRLNGYDACRRIREEPWGRDAVIVACTGWGQDQDRRQAQEAGFDTHMVKPVEPAALAKLLADLGPPAAEADRGRAAPVDAPG
jgi:PAS domain S-box-containing protein